MNTFFIFATHVTTIMEAKPGDKFTLSLGGVTATVHCGENREFYVNDFWTGSVLGAVQEYARLVDADQGADQDTSRKTWDNGFSGDERVELWEDGKGDMWAKTNGGIVTGKDALLALLVAEGINSHAARAYLDHHWL